ncbi:MAG: hypothetical protein V4436_02085 [Patescibacteria group bacterium]
MSTSNELPPLPKTLHKREASVTPKVLAWFKTHHEGPAAIEVKATDTKSIPASKLEPHQRLALLAAMSSEGMTHKLSDEARRRQPFDALLLKNTPAYVVACFTGTGDRICLVIPVEEWCGARSDTKALYTITI